MKKTLFLFLTSLSIFTISCGTTSSLKTNNQDIQKKYSSVSVKNFSTVSGIDGKVGTSFPDKIASYLKGKGVFNKVSRNGSSNADTLVIDGQVTKYREGNATMRLLIGMGAGNANFDALVNFKDGASNSNIGTIKANKNSWALGGAIAAAQTREVLMDGAAKKVANEAAKLGKK